jgi:hypothetical protein
MRADNYIYVIAVIIIAVAFYYFFLSRRAVIHNKIKNTPAKKMADVQNGETVRLSGKVVCLGRTLQAPLSLRKCAYYYVTVKDSSGPREMFRNYIDLKEEKTANVIICDGENYAVIDDDLIELFVTKDAEYISGTWNATTPELKAFLKKHGERTEDYIGWSLDLYAEEGVLEEGEAITIAGRASWRKASEFKFEIPAKRVLYIEALNEHGVYLSDSPYIDGV